MTEQTPAPDKFIDSGLRPVEGDPYAELFADCTTADEVLALQREIDAANDDA